MRRQRLNRQSPLCWLCNGYLVGPGGVPGKEPLSFKLVEIPQSTSVKVHIKCEKDAKELIGGKP